MREIEFRGKRVDNGEWVYGFYFEIEHNDDKTHVHGYITANPLLEKMPESAASFIEVETKTVGQFTGEKDKNGQKLFDGDALDVKLYDWSRADSVIARQNVVIEFRDGCFGFEWGFRKEFTRIKDFSLATFEVVGNIHDNPRLLEQHPCG